MRAIHLAAPAALALAGLAPGQAAAAAEAGLDAGTAALMLGVTGSLALAVYAVIWYPLKRTLQKRGSAGSGKG